MLPGLALLTSQQDALIAKVILILQKAPNQKVQLSASTVLLNMSVASCSSQEDALGQAQCVATIGSIFENISDPEARFRILVALGTLSEASHANRRLAKDLGVKEAVVEWQRAAANGELKKVKECAKLIIDGLV